MRYFLLKWCFGRLARIGCWLQAAISEAEEEHLVATALKPGTAVRPICDCHGKQLWYVEEYCRSGGDYNLVSTWPPPSKFGRRHDVDDMHIERNKVVLAPVLVHPHPSPQCSCGPESRCSYCW